MRLSTLFLLATLLCLPLNVYGQQIAPNPNWGYITLNGNGWYNNNFFYNNGTVFNGGTLTNHGTLSNNTGGTLKNDTGGTLNNSGEIYNNGLSTLANYGTLNNDDTLNNHGGTLANYGTLSNNTGGTLKNYTGGTLNNNGTIDTISGSFINDGVITGTGYINGNVSGNGQIAPGNSSGVLTIDGHLTHYDGGLQIELGGDFNGGGDKSLTEFDWLDVTGNVELAGVLDVYLINSFQLLAGMSFEILKVGGTLTGEYDGLPNGALVGTFSGTDLIINYAGGDGNDVTLYSPAGGPAVPEPAAMLLALLGLALLPRRRRR
jgi:MYXO-CTERM domain-containing protein